MHPKRYTIRWELKERKDHLLGKAEAGKTSWKRHELHLGAIGKVVQQTLRKARANQAGELHINTTVMQKYEALPRQHTSQSSWK